TTHGHQSRGHGKAGRGNGQDVRDVSKGSRFAVQGSAFHLHGLTDFAPAIESPAVGESFALIRLHRLDAAHVFTFEEETGTVGLFDERQVLPIRAELREALDEFFRRQLHGEGVWASAIAPALLAAWKAAEANDVRALLATGDALSGLLSETACERSAAAGELLLRATQGALHQGILGRLRQELEQSRAD